MDIYYQHHINIIQSVIYIINYFIMYYVENTAYPPDPKPTDSGFSKLEVSLVSIHIILLLYQCFNAQIFQHLDLSLLMGSEYMLDWHPIIQE